MAALKIPATIGKGLRLAIEKAEREHPGRIVDVSDERRVGPRGDVNDGIWIYLRGWYWDDPGLHSVHEWNETDVIRQLARIRPCCCSGCTPVSTSLRSAIAESLYRSQSLGMTGGEALALADDVLPAVIDFLRQKFTVAYLQFDPSVPGGIENESGMAVLEELADAIGVRSKS